MSITLDAIHRRVLGVLIEKSLTQPDYYPMTTNALVAGCNQKSNRDPVMDVTEEEVWNVLEQLRAENLVSMILPPPGARTHRFRHEVQAALGWTPREQAVMCELLLRGPQTVGELRTRCSRMATFEDPQVVTNVLGALADRQPPLTAALPREPGRSAVRYAHLMYPEGENPVAAAPAPSAQPAPTPTPTGPSELESLARRVQALEDEVATLREQLSQVRIELGLEVQGE